ncbi:MAG: 1,4-alpha-glucan branching enzyme [Elusimicrobia bacterium RIFOXYA2_FULL_39_19]|nr:MAG: 1,4-alpha-glucan branching enzyme [Elusimicrobia bacterium RIFOXYA2_FULL_39_19]
MQNVIHGVSLFTENDIYLFREGTHYRLYKKLGSHIIEHEGRQGVCFAVWAPNAKSVTVMGNFNGWNADSHPLSIRWDNSGIWEGFIPEIGNGTLYKYRIVSSHNNYTVDKRDPFAFNSEMPPQTASIVWDMKYNWADADWMKTRHKNNSANSPMSIYEMHLGSWRRKPEEENRPLNYRETAQYITEYAGDMGFTHIELLPVMEHPFYGSWGYQTTGYFAPTSRYGTPQDMMFLIDCLHKKGIGVILDWVPSHFPSDEHGLAYFDGTHLFEHADPRKGFHPDWKTYIFNYGRNETRSFLISSALFWLDMYHADGIRVDAVASMIYLDYSREEGEWLPNEFGGRENIEAINFLKTLNTQVYANYPDTQMLAEESTAWPMVSRPVYLGGLGFGMKWNMGWMHDTLNYFAKDPVYRKHHHNQLTFSMLYAFNENFLLPLSHDEVVHGKGSLMNKMPGDYWQKFANLRLFLGYMFTHPGKKLLFMGAELGQWSEWNHESSLDWNLLSFPIHRQLQCWVRDINNFYKEAPALYETDFDNRGFEWIDCCDSNNSVLIFIRKGKTAESTVLVVCNFTPVIRENYRVGVPFEGYWKEILNSDALEYGGSGAGNLGGLDSQQYGCHGRPFSVLLTLPPLGILIFKRQ